MSSDPETEALLALTDEIRVLTDEVRRSTAEAAPAATPVQRGVFLPQWVAGTILASLLTILLGMGTGMLAMRDEMSREFATIQVQIRDIFERRMDSQSDRISDQAQEHRDLEDRFEDHMQQYHNGSGR